MAALLSPLDGFLERATARRFQWGVHDCALFVADWAIATRGADPAAKWRGRYRTERGAFAIIRAAGGLEALLDAGLAAIGGVRTEAPVRGDVGIVPVHTPEGRREGACAVALGEGLWALPGGEGLRAVTAFAVAAWRL